MKNLFISFEGIEGSGKTTQAKRLFKWLTSRGYDCIFTQEPGGTEITKKIRNILLDKKNITLFPLTELFLYLADRAQNVEEIIKPALQAHRVDESPRSHLKIVISDRFMDSTVVYQGAGRGISPTTIKILNLLATSGTIPQLTIFIDIFPKKGLARIKNKDRIESETMDFYEKVRNGYLKLAKEEPNRIKIIDGNLSIKQIEQKVQNLVKQKLVR